MADVVNPGNSTGSGPVSDGGDVKDMLDFLTPDDEKADGSGSSKTQSRGLVNKESSIKDEDSESDEEVKDDEIEEEESTDDEDEFNEDEVTEDETVNEQEPGTITYSKLSKDYPDIFKKNPELRNIIGRENAYSQVFPTVESAKEAGFKAEVFDTFSSQLEQGNPLPLIDQLHKGQKLGEVALNFLPALKAVDNQAFLAATKPFVISLINKIATDAKRNNNEQLSEAALELSEYLFSRREIPKLEVRTQDPRVRAREQELDERERNIFANQYSSFENSVNVITSKTVRKELESLIDPNKAYSDFERSALIDKAMNELDEVVSNDPRHMNNMRQLLNYAVKNSFNKESRDRLISAYLSRARTALPSIRQKVRAEVKKGEVKSRHDGRKYLPGSGGGRTSSTRSNNTKDRGAFFAEAKAKGKSIEDILALGDK